MHSSVSNNPGKTRFSIDFRTVHVDDLAESKGAPKHRFGMHGDHAGDYLRISDWLTCPMSSSRRTTRRRLRGWAPRRHDR
jgi:hypothetical protein